MTGKAALLAGFYANTSALWAGMAISAHLRTIWGPYTAVILRFLSVSSSIKGFQKSSAIEMMDPRADLLPFTGFVEPVKRILSELRNRAKISHTHSSSTPLW